MRRVTHVTHWHAMWGRVVWCLLGAREREQEWYSLDCPEREQDESKSDWTRTLVAIGMGSEEGPQGRGPRAENKILSVLLRRFLRTYFIPGCLIEASKQPWTTIVLGCS